MIIADIGHENDLAIIAEVKAQLQLGLKLDPDGNLPAECVDLVVSTFLDFKRVINASGADHTIAVGTAAIRLAGNGAAVVDQIVKATGIKLRILSGEDEARYAYIGALSGLSAQSGMVIDVGGGSTEIAEFEDRQLRNWWTLPIGSLTLGRLFPMSDPPTSEQLAAAREHASSVLKEAGVPQIKAGHAIIGIGGTIRNLAKVQRRKSRHGFGRLHAYEVSRSDIASITDLIANKPADKRRRVRGLNPERADSIVTGAVIVEAVFGHMAAEKLVVSGYGLREGLLIAEMPEPQASPDELRRRSLIGLGTRFTTWDPQRAELRRQVCRDIAMGINSGEVTENAALIEAAAVIIDAGSSIDYYRRYENAATIIESGSLTGFSHAQLAFVTAALRLIDDGSLAPGRYSGLFKPSDEPELRRAAAILRLADSISWRLSDGLPGAGWCVIEGKVLRIRLPELANWEHDKERARFKRDSAIDLKVTAE